MTLTRLVLLVALLGSATSGVAGGKDKDYDGPRRPLKTKTCVRRDLAGVCREWDYTFAVAGAHCTENCVKFGAMDDCKVRNKCTFDPPSGCFKKRTCLKLNASDDCDQWQEEPACT